MFLNNKLSKWRTIESQEYNNSRKKKVKSTVNLNSKIKGKSAQPNQHSATTTSPKAPTPKKVAKPLRTPSTSSTSNSSSSSNQGRTSEFSLQTSAQWHKRQFQRNLHKFHLNQPLTLKILVWPVLLSSRRIRARKSWLREMTFWLNTLRGWWRWSKHCKMGKLEKHTSTQLRDSSHIMSGTAKIAKIMDTLIFGNDLKGDLMRCSKEGEDSLSISLRKVRNF